MSFDDNVPAVDAADVPQGAFLLDVREPDEWAAGHAPDAHHIPMGELSGRAAEIPRDRDVYVICRSGVRSAHVTIALNNAGWLAKNVDGGYHSWAGRGLPMVADSGAEPAVA
jgi:rhodanese-related sulfurtransferase